jgi:hypothetical protein
VRSAGEIALFELQVAEHLLDELDVFRLPTVGSTRNGQLLIAPVESVEAARREKWKDLERLGAGSPEGESVGVARRAEELVSLSNYRGVYSMLRLGPFTAGDCNIELVRLDHTSRYSD